MTAPLSAAESFLTLLDDLAGTKPNGATAAVLLKHAAGTIRGLLAELEEERQLDEVLVGVRENVRDHVAANLRSPHLSHLPQRAADGEDMCNADSEPEAISDYWACTARRGHPERWHASHHNDGRPWAAEFPAAAWPVVDHETGLPNMALDGALACGALEETGGRWLCNAVAGHGPLDHVTFTTGAKVRMPGAVLARWPSVRPQDVPRPGQDAEDAGASRSSITGPGHLNGHALRPPEWVCSRCEGRFPGRKPEDGLCAGCGWDQTRNFPELTVVDGGDTG